MENNVPKLEPKGLKMERIVFKPVMHTQPRALPYIKKLVKFGLISYNEISFQGEQPRFLLLDGKDRSLVYKFKNQVNMLKNVMKTSQKFSIIYAKEIIH
jgi:hypothetical protein